MTENDDVPDHLLPYQNSEFSTGDYQAMNAFPQPRNGVLDLSSLKLNQIDHLPLFPNVTTLKLCNNNVTSIDCTNLPDHLQKLDLSNNKIKTITNVEQLHNLQELDLSKNQCDVLPNLRACANLLHLNISKNNIAIADHANLPTTLRSVNLSHNRIDTVTGDWHNNVALRIMNLSHNKLADRLWSTDFPNSIEDLNLSHNKIKNVSLDGLVGLKKLNNLDLSHNEIERISEWDFPIGIRTLDVSHNPKLGLLNFDKSKLPHLTTFRDDHIRSRMTLRQLWFGICAACIGLVSTLIIAEKISESRHKKHHKNKPSSFCTICCIKEKENLLSNTRGAVA